MGGLGGGLGFARGSLEPGADFFLGAEGGAGAAHQGVAEFAVEEAGLGVVAPLEVEAALELLLESGIVDGADDFEAAVEIAGEEVGGAEEVAGLAAVAEGEDAAVFEELVDDADGADIFARGFAGDDGEHAADDELDGDAGAAGFVEEAGDFGVGEVIEFEGDAAVAAVAGVVDFGLDPRFEAVAEAEGGGEEVAEFGLLASSP